MTMRCPFRYRSQTKYNFGVDPGFMDFVEEQESQNEAVFNRLYPTCWSKFLYWLRT